MAFVLYDVETSGLNKRFDQILQFAAVRTDADLVETDRFETRSRLMPHVIPSPKALHVNGTTLSEANSISRPSHYSMVCEIAEILASWSPATFLGYNSIRFDEEFLRQAFYECLHPIFLTNTNGNARADVLNLMRAATTLYPSLIQPGVESDGRPSHRLGPLAEANGVAQSRAHEAEADVDAMLGLCRIVHEKAPMLWSAFLRYSSKASAIGLVRDEDAFAYFDFFGTPRCMHFLTRVGASPNDANAHYCLDLEYDIDSLRALDDTGLAERLAQEPKPVRRLKMNASPLLYPLWDLEADQFTGLTEEELIRRASSVRADEDFMAALTRAAAFNEPVYASSEHVELQIYGGKFLSDRDLDLCRRFHAVPWSDRLGLIRSFEDSRLKRLALRLMYFESPQLLDDARRSAIAEDIRLRRLGEGKYALPPWTTIPKALVEAEGMGQEISETFRLAFDISP